MYARAFILLTTMWGPLAFAQSSLPLRRESPIAQGFVFQLLFATLVSLGAVYVLLRLAVRKGWFASMSAPADAQMKVVEFVRLSPKTRLFHVVIEGKKAVVVESVNGSHLYWQPGAMSAPPAGLPLDANEQES